MYSPLEEYLNEVAERLSPLPVARKNEELKEMRQHLQNAITVNPEFGQDEVGAVADAIAQFGEPQGLADRIVGAWLREETLKKRALCLSTFATPVILGGLLYLLCGCEILELLWPSFNGFFIRHPEQGRIVVHGSFFVVFALTGLTVGLAFPVQAVRGICLGLAAYTVIWCGQSGWRVDIPTQPGQFMAYGENMACYLTCVLAAWATSRWRGRQTDARTALRA